MRVTVLLFLLIGVYCNAQQPIISMEARENDYSIELTPGCYYKDTTNAYQPFVGTWEWTDGSSTLTLVFEKIEMVYVHFSDIYEDYLVGKYKYVEDGIVVVNTLDNVVNSTNFWSGAYVPIYGSGHPSDLTSHFQFSDYAKEKLGNGRLEITEYLTQSNGSILATKADWSLRGKGGIYIEGISPEIQPGFSIPTDVTLTKIN